MGVFISPLNVDNYKCTGSGVKPVSINFFLSTELFRPHEPSTVFGRQSNRVGDQLTEIGRGHNRVTSN